VRQMLRRAPASQSAQNHLVTKTQSVKRLNPIPLLISDDEIIDVSYVIKSSDEEVVLSDKLNNIEHQVDISSLCAGTYYIEVLYNGIVYW